jgi:hypothetical protein
MTLDGFLIYMFGVIISFILWFIIPNHIQKLEEDRWIDYFIFSIFSWLGIFLFIGEKITDFVIKNSK